MKCPHCHAALDGHDALRTERRPKVGDYSCCNACGRFSRFDADDSGLKLRMLNEEELLSIQDHPDYQALRTTFLHGEDWRAHYIRWRDYLYKREEET